jgi:uncharacterized repeat protein (TIGR02543 family)
MFGNFRKKFDTAGIRDGGAAASGACVPNARGAADINACGDTSARDGRVAGSKRALGIFAFTLAFALTVTAICTAGVSPAYSDEPAASADEGAANGHSKTLTPGEVYDVSTASANTTVYIKQGGTYTLKGKSSKMHVEIKNEGADVTLILADGLNIDTDSTSASGASTPAIDVGDHGGTVTILTTPGGAAKLSGYIGSPAIQKDGTKTKLVFDTQDHSKWGTLRATGSLSVLEGGAGIGSSSYLSFGESITGNIVIESGRIYAQGGSNCAGIGGGDNGTLDGLTINGGYVDARGGGTQAFRSIGGGAGIGAGAAGRATNITINGGEIYAYGGENGAGIGGAHKSSSSGSGSGEATNITINGGKVHASGNWGGAGIGGGWEADASDITIAGGTVAAYGGKAGSCAIGGGGGNFYGTGSNITISGGDITATCEGNFKYGAVIGSTSNGKSTTSVNITGGQINVSGNAGYLIGGGTKKVNITISGGTITSTGKATKIGSHSSKTTISIIGGSVNANMSDTPINQNGDKLSLTTVTLSNAAKGTKVNSITTEGISPAYGMKDVYTLNDGKLYFWFPNNSKITRATTNSDSMYGGLVEAGKEGVLYPPTKVTLDSNGGTDGSAFVFLGDTELSDVVEPVHWGYYVTHYEDSSGAEVAGTNGKLYPNSQFTDAQSKWTSTADTVTLKTSWGSKSYTVEYDANVPVDASTSVTGETKDGTAWHKIPFYVAACGYVLPGYEFDSWNTKADGSGISVGQDGYYNADLEEYRDGYAKLYAIWKPCEYTVTFEGGDAGGSSYTQTMVFDQPTALTTSQFSAPEGKKFLGWTTNAAIVGLLKDEATLVNLCSLDASGKPQGATLTATWAGQGQVSIIVTRNGVPATGFGNALTLTAGGGIYGYFEEDAQAPGVYTLDNVAPGTYGIGLDGFTTTGKNIEVSADGSGIAWLDYCDVQIEGDAHCTASLGSGTTTTQIKDVPVGSALSIGTAKCDTGYRFSEYVATGTDPTWQDGDTTLASQTVTINGQTTIKAISNPVHYKVVFDANGGNGGMTEQVFEYDSPQTLSLNAFSKNHNSFACWTLTPTWSGTTYVDQAEVVNLACEEGATVTLYAQYTPDSWWIEFNGNGGDVGYMDSQKMFFGTSSKLQKCTMTMEDCTFRGWNTEADGTGTSYADEAEVLDLATASDEVVTLWAQWERDYYTVEFNANGGVGTMYPQTIFANDEDVLDGNTFTRSGYTFAGWNTKANGSGTAYEDGAEVFGLVDEYEAITLYAQWEEVAEPDDSSGSGDGSGSGGSGSVVATGDVTGTIAVGAAAMGTLAMLAAFAITIARRRRKS